MAALIEAVDKLAEEAVKPVLRMLLVDMAARAEVVFEGQRIVGYWVGNQVRIDIKIAIEKKKGEGAGKVGTDLPGSGLIHGT